MSRRTWRHNVSRLRLHRSYTSRELAETLGVHTRTIQAWRKGGLTPITGSENQALYLGRQAIDFLKARMAARKSSLKPNQFFCLRCRAARPAKPDSVQVDVTNRRIGTTATQVLVSAVCVNCGAKMVRFATTKTITQTPWWPKMRQADKRLMGTPLPSLNTDMKQG